MKKFFTAAWEFFKYLFLTPSWGNKRRKTQQEYEDQLDRAMSASEAKQNAGA